MTTHMEPISVDEAVSAIAAANTVERLVWAEGTARGAALAAMTVDEVVAVARAATVRQWVMVGRGRFQLRMETADEAFLLPTVTAPADT